VEGLVVLAQTWWLAVMSHCRYDKCSQSFHDGDYLTLDVFVREPFLGGVYAGISHYFLVRCKILMVAESGFKGKVFM
jgi:hypothetical protein